MGQEEIFDFLKANMDVWLNIKQISTVLNMNTPHLHRCLSKMKKYPNIYVGLEEKHQREIRSNGQYAIKYYRINGNIYKSVEQ